VPSPSINCVLATLCVSVYSSCGTCTYHVTLSTCCNLFPQAQLLLETLASASSSSLGALKLAAALVEEVLSATPEGLVAESHTSLLKIPGHRLTSAQAPEHLGGARDSSVSSTGSSEVSALPSEVYSLPYLLPR
jgi:hypothetical protein